MRRGEVYEGFWWGNLRKEDNIKMDLKTGMGKHGLD
jgi:hypothetical protein